MSVYVDTSALLKWYVNEEGSEEFEVFVHEEASLVTSAISRIEFASALARRLRRDELRPHHARSIVSAFERDLVSGQVSVQPVSDAQVVRAVELVEQLGRTKGLRTLDALHLASLTIAKAEMLATADRVMAECAGALGVKTRIFG
jgi:predicted nucleic acid-binding protein